MKSTCLRLPVWILLATLCSVSNPAKAGLINGEFESPGVASVFDGWTTFNSPFYVAPNDAIGFSGNTVAQFQINAFSDPFVQLEQTFSLSADATSLSFDIQISTQTGGESGGIFLDSFVASLYDDTFTPIHPTDTFLDGFFAFDSDGTESYPHPFVTVTPLGNNAKRVTLDVSSYASTQVTLDFALFGGNEGLITTAHVDNVRTAANNPIPEPSAMVVWLGITCSLLTLRRNRLSLS